MKENCNQEYGTRYPTLCFYSGGVGQAQDGKPCFTEKEKGPVLFILLVAVCAIIAFARGWLKI